MLRDRLAEDREAAGRAEAKNRMKGVARAHGSLAQQLNDDEARLQEAAAVYKANQVVGRQVWNQHDALIEIPGP